MKFKIFGNENVLSTHPTTLEFTKDDFLTRNGDCIVGIKSDFHVLKKVVSAKKIKIIINCEGLTDSLTADVNPDFDDNHEIVIRKSGFISKRTLGINASKSSKEIDRGIIKKLTNPDVFAEVVIEVLE